MWRRIRGEEDDDRKLFFLWPWLAFVAAIVSFFLLAGRNMHPRVQATVHPAATHAARPVIPSDHQGTSIVRQGTSIVRQGISIVHRGTFLPRQVAGSPILLSPGSARPSAYPVLSRAAVQLPRHPLFNASPITARSPAVRKPGPIPCWDPQDSHASTWSLSIYDLTESALASGHHPLSYGLGFLLRKDIYAGISVAAGLQYTWDNTGFVDDSLSFVLGRHFTEVDLPMLAGYEKEFGGIRVAADAGFVLNLRTTATDGLFKYGYNTGFSAYLGLRLTKPLNEQWSLFAAPFYRRQLSDRASPYPVYPTAVDRGGLMLGIKYDLRIYRTREAAGKK